MKVRREAAPTFISLDDPDRLDLARPELQVAYPALLRRFPDLEVTVPTDRVRFRDEMVVHGVHDLPVTW